MHALKFILYELIEITIHIVDVFFLKSTEKKPPFSKIPGYVQTVKYNSKTLCVEEEKSPFSKKTGYVWTRL